MLEACRVDAIISARSLTVNAMRTEEMDPARFRIGENVAEFDVAAAISNGSEPAIVRRLRDSLQDMKTNGSLQETLLKTGSRRHRISSRSQQIERTPCPVKAPGTPAHSDGNGYCQPARAKVGET